MPLTPSHVSFDFLQVYTSKFSINLLDYTYCFHIDMHCSWAVGQLFLKRKSKTNAILTLELSSFFHINILLNLQRNKYYLFVQQNKKGNLTYKKVHTSKHKLVFRPFFPSVRCVMLMNTLTRMHFFNPLITYLAKLLCQDSKYEWLLLSFLLDSDFL